MFSASDIFDDPKPVFLEGKVEIKSRSSPTLIETKDSTPRADQQSSNINSQNSDYPKIVDGIEIISQIQEKIVFSHDRIVTVHGCAGSRKTDTLCKYGYKQFREGKNVLFLTLVSSVTDEIKTRLQKLIGLSIPRIRKSNNFCTVVTVPDRGDVTVQISNFDAFIHRQLLNIGHTILQDGGDLHSEKASCLLASSHNGADLVNDEKADVILIDEFQDLQLTKVKILVKILEANKEMRGIAVGDFLQSIFDHAITTDGRYDTHPLTLWSQCLGSAKYEINTCYRCPEPQINFANMIMQEYQQKHNLLPMAAYNRDTIHKPIIFVHEDISKKGGNNNPGMLIADQVEKIIKTILKFDEQVRPEDIAILVKNSNDNKIVNQLQTMMKDKLHHFATIEDGIHATIRWENADDKTIAISIHGIKGKGKKVVILLNMSNKALPEEQNLFNPTEILDYSLLNVGLTRSEKYLVVGIPSTSPTRYFFNKKSHLDKFAYCTWSDNKTVQANFPLMYKRIVRAISKSLWNTIMRREEKYFRLRPMFNPDHYSRNYPVNIPPRRILRVSVEIAKAIEHPKYLLDVFADFGKPLYLNDAGPTSTNFDNKLTLDERAILGNMAELLVNRHLYVTTGLDLFKRTFNPVLHRLEAVHYTDNDVLLNLIADFNLNGFALPTIHLRESDIARDEFDMWQFRIRLIQNDNKYLLAKKQRDVYYDLMRLYSGRPKIIVHRRFDSDDFREQLRKLYDRNLSNKEISSTIFWNATIYNMMFYERSRRPGIIWSYDTFRHDVTTLHNNVELYCSKFLHANESRTISASPGSFSAQETKEQAPSSPVSQVTYNLMLEASENDLKQLGYQGNELKEQFVYGLSGRCDLYDRKEQKIIELKASVKTEISKEWMIQALMYSVLLPERNYQQKEIAKNYRPMQFQIVNLLRGVVYQFKLPSTMNRSQVIRNTLKKLGWQDVLIDNIVKAFYGSSALN